MKVVIGCGGTGGHVYPALAIAEEINKDSGEISFIGKNNSFESDKLGLTKYEFFGINIFGIRRGKIFQNIKPVFHLIRSYFKVRTRLKLIKPDFVIGTGGYVSFITVYVASKLKIPTYIHEQNAFPGLANRILEKHVRKVFLGFEDISNQFKFKNKQILVGNPVRNEFFIPSKAKNDMKNILILGGSIGSKIINESSLELIDKYRNRDDISITLITGKRGYKDFIQSVDSSMSNLEIIEYCENIYDKMKEASIIIARSGAISLTEIMALGKASILIPYKYAANDHQLYNAKLLSERNAAILIEENNLSGTILYKEVSKLLEDSKLLNSMSNNAFNDNSKHSASNIYKIIKEDIGCIKL